MRPNVAKTPKPTKSPPSFRREDRDEFRTMLSIFLARVISWAVLLMPGPIRNYVALRMGSLSFRLSHGYRQNVESNVRVVTGRQTNDQEVRELTRSIFLANALNFMDLLTLSWRSTNWFNRGALVVYGDWSVVDKALERGKGVIFLSAHVGCFDFIGQAIRAQGYPLTVVTGRTTSRFVFDGVTWLRGRRGAHMVEPTPSGIRHVIRALRNNECAVLVADRDFFENGFEVEFFGQVTTLPPGAVRLARDTGAAIVPMFTRRTNRGHEVRIMSPMYIEKSRDVQADVAVGMKQLVPVLEQGIGSALEQWVMFQRVWPEVTPDPIRIFPTGSPLESPLLERVAQKLPERSSGDESAPLRKRGTESDEVGAASDD
jgi:KDO2-lipid IV(A) lauroyltransferase